MVGTDNFLSKLRGKPKTMDTVVEHDYDFLDGIDKRWVHGLGADEENNFPKQKHSTFK